MSKTRICLDPGHGGSDPGAVGAGGLRESVVNLAVSSALANLLNQRPELESRLTRSTETVLSLSARSQIANDWNAHFFISIHCNSNGPSASGIETLYKTNSGKALADPIQKALIAGTGERDRGLKVRNDLAVLNSTRMPAVLVELGFISHAETEARLASDPYRIRLATSIAAGITQFLNLIAVPPIPPVEPPPVTRPLVIISAPASVEIKVVQT